MTAVAVAGSLSNDDHGRHHGGPRPRVVVCGPEHALSEIRRVQTALASVGIRAVVSEPPPAWADSQDQDRLAKVLQIRDMRRLHDRRTRALIIVNHDINGIFDAVDPWSLCQASVAFYRGLSVYLWRGLPLLFEEQLALWGAETLHEDLHRLPIADLIEEVHSGPRPYSEQLTLFDVPGGPFDERHPTSLNPLLRHPLSQGSRG